MSTFIHLMTEVVSETFHFLRMDCSSSWEQTSISAICLTFLIHAQTYTHTHPCTPKRYCHVLWILAILCDKKLFTMSFSKTPIFTKLKGNCRTSNCYFEQTQLLQNDQQQMALGVPFLRLKVQKCTVYSPKFSKCYNLCLKGTNWLRGKLISGHGPGGKALLVLLCSNGKRLKTASFLSLQF